MGWGSVPAFEIPVVCGSTLLLALIGTVMAIVFAGGSYNSLDAGDKKPIRVHILVLFYRDGHCTGVADFPLLLAIFASCRHCAEYGARWNHNAIWKMGNTKYATTHWHGMWNVLEIRREFSDGLFSD